jgi:7-carboxy-7-deazaguanine synthase
MSISPKLSNSTPEGPFRNQHERLRIQPAVLHQLMSQYDYQLKFVIAREEDVPEMQVLLEQLRAPAQSVVLMPEGVTEETLDRRSPWIAEVCKKYGYRFSPRLHVHLYGNLRGV